VPVTFTENVQEALAARFAPVNAMLDDPALAVIEPVPHVPVSPLGVETERPEGSVSVKPIPLSEAVAFGFVTVKLRVVAPFSDTKAPPKALLIVGGATTVIAAVSLVAPAPVSLAATAPVVFD